MAKDKKTFDLADLPNSKRDAQGPLLDEQTRAAVAKVDVVWTVEAPPEKTQNLLKQEITSGPNYDVKTTAGKVTGVKATLRF